MKMQVYLNADGCEKVALGQKPQYYEWGICPYENPYTPGKVFDIPKGSFKVLEVEVRTPRASEVDQLAVAALKEKLQQSYVAAAAEQKELQERINKLLALPAPSSSQVMSERELQGVDIEPDLSPCPPFGGQAFEDIPF